MSKAASLKMNLLLICLKEALLQWAKLIKCDNKVFFLVLDVFVKTKNVFWLN